jgi:hypothetical protein
MVVNRETKFLHINDISNQIQLAVISFTQRVSIDSGNEGTKFRGDRVPTKKNSADEAKAAQTKVG